MSLTKTAISGMIWTYSQQFGSQLISFIVSVVLARLVLPSEYGLIGMIGIFMSLGTALFDGGLTSSLIRSNDANEEDYSTVFYFNFLGSILIYFVLFIAAPWIADFYHQKPLVNIIRVYGFTFIISAFGTVQNTILTKTLQFKKQAVISFPALILSSITGLTMAYLGYGVWSLVISIMTNALFTSLFLWFSSEWYPQLVFNKLKFKTHFNYGYKLTLSSILDTVYTNIYQIVIGRYYSAAQVGYYTRANTLMMLPVGNISGALNRVVFPLFSKVQDDIPRFRNAYKEIMLLVLFIITPVLIIMSLLARPLIELLFTAKWLPVVPIFQIICLTGILYPIHSYNLIVLQVKGRSDLFLRLEIIKKILGTVVLIISFFYGFYALLYGQVFFSVIALFINTHYAGKMLKYSMVRQLIDLLPIFAFTICMTLAVYVIDTLLINQLNIVRLLAGGIGGAVIYVALAWIFKFQSIKYIINLINRR